MASTSRTAAWDGTLVRLSLCPLLRPVESEGAQATSAFADLVAALSGIGSANLRRVMSASATRDVLQRLSVPNFDAYFLFLLFHFRRSFLICSTHLDHLGISICAKDV